MEHPLQILERYWNYTSFRLNQEAIINATIAGEDVFALLPTGGGKSLCFQIPALAKEGICIVITPLVALMKEQVQNLNNRGIKAMSLHSGISYNELDTLLDNCIYGNYKFLYLSPERLQQDIIQDRIRLMNVNLIAVDEAHCISQWGNDFRPSYRQIIKLRELQPTANVIALTATATEPVCKDIIASLDFIQPKQFKSSFKRSNLAFFTYHEEDKLYRIETILKKYKSSSIIYVRSRKLTQNISQSLEKKGFSSTYFHGGLSNNEKEQRLNDWLNNKKQIMVATNAFGMGIDKPDVKTVIHINLPESLESYYQEAGRAGRNGEKAFAIILKNDNDLTLIKNQFLEVLPDGDFVKQVYRKLCNYFQISYGEGMYSIFDFNFNQFCLTYNFNPIITHNALQFLDRTSIISLSKQFSNKTQIQFIVSTNDLFSYLEQHESLNLVVKTLLRTYGGISDYITKINTNLIANKASVNEDELIESLLTLEKDNIITLNHSKTDVQITFIEPREDDKTIHRVLNVLDQQNKLKTQQVESVLNYVTNDRICKSIQLLHYYGETDAEPCGICSVCSSNQTNIDYKSLQKVIILALEKEQLSSRKLAEKIRTSEKDLNSVLELMLEHRMISITNTNTYKLYHT